MKIKHLSLRGGILIVFLLSLSPTGFTAEARDVQAVKIERGKYLSFEQARLLVTSKVSRLKTHAVLMYRTAAGTFWDLWSKCKGWYGNRMHKLKKTDQVKTISRQLNVVKSQARELAHAMKIAPVSTEEAVIYLKNGNAVSGKILTEDEAAVTVYWMDGEITFSKGEVLRIERGRTIAENSGIFLADRMGRTNEWQYRNNPAIRLTNGQIIDQKISAVTTDQIVVHEDLGGGAFIDQPIPRSRVEQLIFKPVTNQESRDIEEQLRKQFLRMEFYDEGVVTLVTDTKGSSLKTLRRSLRQAATDIYLDMFDLLKTRSPRFQIYAVVFDDYLQWFEYGLADGVPILAIAGYFDFIEKVLFLHNGFGDQMADMVDEVVSGMRGQLNSVGEQAKSAYGDRYAVQIDGAVQDQKMLMDNYIGYVMNYMSGSTLETLRHEIVHAFLNSWDAMNIIRSKVPDTSPDVIKKRQELLETDDIKKKTELIKQLLGAQEESMGKIADDLVQDANNSWFSEGVAEYLATDPPGLILESRLYALKEARRNEELMPLEHLTVYKMGSFRGVVHGAALSAYSQSWSLAHFLMEKHRKPFLKYLDRMATQNPKQNDDLNWLLEELDTDLRLLEMEWYVHIDEMPEVEDPQIKHWWKVRSIFGMN